MDVVEEAKEAGKLERTKSVFEMLQRTVDPNGMRHRKVISSVPAAVHGVPESLKTKRDIEERLKKMGRFCSANYDSTDSDIQRQMELNRSEHDYDNEERWKWILAVFIGFTMGAVTFLIDTGIEQLTAFKYRTAKTDIERFGGFWRPYFIYVGLCVFYAACAGMIVSLFEPLAAGSGIPEMKTYLNGVHIRNLLAVKTFFCKMVGVMFTISAGLIAGKAGPFVHGGGCVGGGISQMGSQRLSRLVNRQVATKRTRGGYARNEPDHRDFTAIGAGTGVATVFGAPIGGLLFMVEEMSSFYSTSVFWRGFLSTCLGVMTVHTLQAIKADPEALYKTRLGSFRTFGLYSDDVGQYTFHFYVWELPAFVLLGCLGGCLGSLFIKVNLNILAWRQKVIPPTKPWKRVAEVVAICFITQSLFFLLSFHSPCHPLPPVSSFRLSIYATQQNLANTDASVGIVNTTSVPNFPKLWCEEGTYSLFGQFFFAPPAQGLRMLIHLDETFIDGFSFHTGMLLVYFFLMFFFMIWTFGIGAATGLFVPSLVVGGSFGRLYGKLIRVLVRAVVPGSTAVSPASYAAVGAASVLTGVTRLTMCIAVLVMETTGALQIIVPIMTGVFFAKLIGDAFDLGLHDVLIKVRGAPVLLEPNLRYQQKMVNMKLTAEDIMTSDLVALPPICTLRQLFRALKTTTHDSFPLAWTHTHDARGTGGGGGGGGLARNSVGLAPAGPIVPPPTTPSSTTLHRPSTSLVDATSGEMIRTAGEGFDIVGVIDRTTILRMLKHRIGLMPAPPAAQLFSTPVRPPSTSTTAGFTFHASTSCVACALAALPLHAYSSEERLVALEQLEQYPFKVRPLDDQTTILRSIPLFEQENMLIDMRRFMQRNPLTVASDATLDRAYRLFRTMGLKYLFVTPSQPHVVGLITRKDLCEERAQLTLLNKALSQGLLKEGFLGDVEAQEEQLTAEMRQFWKNVLEKPLSRLPFLDYLEAGWIRGKRVVGSRSMMLNRPSSGTELTRSSVQSSIMGLDRDASIDASLARSSHSVGKLSEIVEKG